MIERLVAERRQAVDARVSKPPRHIHPPASGSSMKPNEKQPGLFGD
jgi:hypothetical protein